MTTDYPWANSTTRTGSCVLCDLTTPHPDRDPEAIMYHITFSADPKDHALICKAHAIECDLITDRLVAAKTRAEVAVIQHLRGEGHRHDVCPMSHGETDPEPLHDCGLCDSPLKFNGWNDDGTATWTCTKCNWFHLSTDCCEQANRPSHRETVPPFPDSMQIRTRAAADAMSPDEVLAIEHIRNRHVPGRYPVTCAMCKLQNRLDSINLLVERFRNRLTVRRERSESP